MAVRYNNACWAAPSDVLLFAVLLVTVAEARHQPLKTAQMGACGPNKIVLSAQHPEHAFAFPDEGSEHSIGSFRFGERVHNNASTDPTMNRLPNDVFIPEKGYLYSCHWVIMTDSSHAISAIFDFSSEDGYSLSAEDDFGYIDKSVSYLIYYSFSCDALQISCTSSLECSPS
ncbi:hypothetical protein Tcan_04354 [Toxocara canis]|uniref:CUB domain-containing protein n=2 Tax=Toxocara canis TaxID=6265 RepID=A0A0B2VIN2_TOXCA|nr:hypothetical protein Tcan_04354 [Toxocara canis]VDM47401.1 unnamed protein product [Toxocara canis]